MSSEAYKFLRAGRLPLHGRGAWTPGKARSVRGQLEPCKRGIHYCRAEYLAYWISEELWTFEDLTPDEAFEFDTKVVTRKGRIVEQLTGWNKRTARLFAADCAERAWEQVYSNDDRPRRAIQAARDYAHGLIGEEALRRAAEVALVAADAVYAAARPGTGSAADALYAFHAAADAAAYAAYSGGAARAARAAERAWQAKRILDYAYGRAE
jgi:hypothetical protein